MAKDPAVLFYIDKWLLATKEMKPDCKSWYHSLILHQFDKKSLPNDLEELANLADVRISEFERFKQVFEQVLKHKFKENEQGRLVNDFAMEIITNREQFKEKRSNAGKMSYFAKFMRKICTDENVIQFVLKNTDYEILDTKNEQMLKQVFEQKSKLYISVSGNVNGSIITNKYTYDNILCLEILTFFKFNETANFDKLRQIGDFHKCLFIQGRLDYFTSNFKSYKQLKLLNPKYMHSFKNFLGDKEIHYTDGAWNLENWTEKLKIEKNGKTIKSANNSTGREEFGRL